MTQGRVSVSYNDAKRVGSETVFKSYISISPWFLFVFKMIMTMILVLLGNWLLT